MLIAAIADMMILVQDVAARVRSLLTHLFLASGHLPLGIRRSCPNYLSKFLFKMNIYFEWMFKAGFVEILLILTGKLLSDPPE